MALDPTTDTDPTDVPLQKARRDFLAYKKETQKDSTARAYKYPTKSFIQFCHTRQVRRTSNITKGMVTNWIDSRREEVKPITAKNNAKHIRVFLKWMGSRDLCDYGIHQKIQIPDIPENDDVSDEVLRESHAETVLDHLDVYQYGTRYHALFYTMWHTGCRISGAMAIDVSDVKFSSYDDNVIQFRNRPERGTPLKNKSGSERDVTISEDLATVLQDYLSMHHEKVTDDFDREPLFTTPAGRVNRQRAYKNVVAVTRPCVVTNECPHNRDIQSCEAAKNKEQAPSCPSSVSLHPVRKGSITNHINEGWPKEPLSERVDVSVDVLEKHYDFRTTEKKRQNRREHLHD